MVIATKYVTVRILLLLSVQLTYSTLSKSETKGKKPTAKPDKKSGEQIDKTYTAEDVLSAHDKVKYTGERHFTQPVLGYVTPWNAHGYNVAKHLAHKFTHVSPVWLQIIPGAKLGTYTIKGGHDIDRDWMGDVRKNNSEIKIVPRFILEDFTSKSLHELLLEGETTQDEFALTVGNYITRNKFDGLVLECWYQLLQTPGLGTIEPVIYALRNIGEALRERGLAFIIPVPPPLDAAMNQVSYITADHFAALFDYVDFINVMTYDFPAQRKPSPTAPLAWVRDCVNALLRADPAAASKLMLGINMYGYDHGGVPSPIVGKQYLSLLKTHKPELIWNREAAEHLFHYSDGRLEHTVYYPTEWSISHRLDLAKTLGVGVGLWDIGQGLDHFYNLF